MFVLVPKLVSLEFRTKIVRLKGHDNAYTKKLKVTKTEKLKRGHPKIWRAKNLKITKPSTKVNLERLNGSCIHDPH